MIETPNLFASRSMKSLALLVCLAAIPVFPNRVAAQLIPHDRKADGLTAGGYVAWGWHFLRGDFAVAPGGEISDSSACGKFERGDGTSVVMGVTIDDRFQQEDLRVGLSLDITQRTGDLRFNCIDPASTRLPDSSTTLALTEHIASVSSITLSVMPWFGISFGSLLLRGGPVATMSFGSTYNAREEVRSPTTAEFVSTGGQVRSYGDGKFAIGAPGLGVGAMIGWRVPISSSWRAEPFVAGHLALTSEYSGGEIRSNGLMAGVAVMYASRTSLPPAVTEPPEPLPVPQVALSVGERLGDGTLDTGHITIRRKLSVSTRLHPLLSYIFFDENSSTIPSRYVQRDALDATNFSVGMMHGRSTLDIYHNLLDIIGERMRRNPTASIVVEGFEPERSGTSSHTLAEARAASVSGYMRGVWGISAERISIVTAHNPRTPTNPDTPEGAAENRRVEISSDNPAITAPILFADTSVVLLLPRVEAEVSATVATSSPSVWHLRTTVGNNRIQHILTRERHEQQAVVVIPDSIVVGWMSSGEEPAVTVEVNHGGALPKTTRTEQIGISVIDTLVSGDYTSGTYSLILFDFFSAGLRPEHLRIMDLVNSRTDPSASAQVRGYTDPLGADDINQRLSEERAEAIATLLRVSNVEIEGRGESHRLYDPTLPEGRFYSRSVVIVVGRP